MNYAEREVRNNIIVNLRKAGLGQKAIGEAVNLTQQGVSKILAATDKDLPLTRKPPGYLRRLTDEQLAELPKFLAQGAEDDGFSGSSWTHERVREVIKKEFRVAYEVKQVGRIIALIGWTRQKPQKKEIKQDLKKVEKWRTQELPALKKKR